MNKLFAKISIPNIAIALVIAIFFIVDRCLKYLALNLSGAEPLRIVGNIFSFQFTANSYMAFSLPFGGWLLDALIILIIGLLIYYIVYLTLNKKEQRWTIILLTFILFGAISNVLDRFIFGYVIDYLSLKYFTVFNLADIMISVGAIILILKLKK